MSVCRVGGLEKSVSPFLHTKATQCRVIFFDFLHEEKEGGAECTL